MHLKLLCCTGLEHVKTPLVMILQHDRGFVRGFNALPIVRTMLAKPNLYNYIAVPTSSMRDYRNFVSSKYQLQVQTVEEVDGLRLVQMVQYFDSTHFANVNWYRNVVFCPGGNFVRPKYVQALLHALQ